MSPPADSWRPPGGSCTELGDQDATDGRKEHQDTVVTNLAVEEQRHKVFVGEKTDNHQLANADIEDLDKAIVLTDEILALKMAIKYLDKQLFEKKSTRSPMEKTCRHREVADNSQKEH